MLMSDLRESITVRQATADDLAAIIDMLADDPIGATREIVSDPPNDSYLRAFADIDGDPFNELVVADDAGVVVGCLQLTFIPGLARTGMLRAQIEAVRIAASHRSRGLGRYLFLWAIDRARTRGAGLVQLTTDKARPDAHRFYETLGFEASHEGMKLKLS